MTEERRIQLVAEVDTTQTRTGFAEIGQQAGQMANAVERQGDRAEQAVAGIGNGASTAARNVEAAQRSLIASIQRTTAQMEAGSRTNAQYFEVLARQRGVDPNVLTPYLNQLRAVQQAQNQTGASSAQVANAMRLVPAQLSDIAVQLAGGQSPVMVMMQQGSQLRDMFGSIPAAARGVASSLMGLVTPYTALAAAIAAVAFAYKSGSDEAASYSRELAITNNAVGATVSQMSAAASEIRQITGSKGAAGDALNALVGTGQVAVENLQRFGLLAVQVQDTVGRSINDTANDFAELGRTPLAALEKINEKYHFITAATYAQVKALQDQGKATEAANVAQLAYADGIERQKDRVLQTMQSWEKAWLGLKMYAADAANWTIDLFGGRTKSDFEQINSLLADRAGLEENQRRARARGLTATVAEYQAELDANKRAIDSIHDKGKAQRESAKAEGDAVQITEARNKWLAEGDKYLSRSSQLERDLTKARNEGAAAHLSQADIEKRLADIRKAYSDIFNDQIDARIAKLQRLDQVQDVLTQRELARVAARKALGDISEADAINQTAAAELAAFDRKKKLIEDEISETRKKANSDKTLADLRGQLDVLDEQRTNRAKQRNNDLALVEQRRLQASMALYTSGIVAATAERNSLIATIEAQFQYNQEIGLSQTQVADLHAARLDNAAALKEEAAAALEALDPSSELAANYREQAQALRDLGDAMMRGAGRQQRYDQFKQAVSDYDQIFKQGFADMLNNGEAGWHSFTKSLVTTFKTSVADELHKMFARPFVVQLVGAFTGVSQQVIAGEIAASAPVLGGAATGLGGAAGLASAFGAGGVGGSLMAGAGWLTGSSTLAGSLGAAGSLIGSGSMAGIASGIGMGIGALGPIALGIAAGASLWNKAFGMGDKQVTSAGMRGTLSAAGLMGENYSSWHQDGGWFRSDKNGTDVSAFSSAVSKQFTQGFASIEDAAANMAQSIGLSAGMLDGYSKTFDIALGKDQAANEKAITDFFTGLSDEIANKLVPNLDQFGKSGESASATLQRLAGDFDATNTMAQMLGKSALAVFGSLGMDSAAARERLVGLFGGTQSLGQLTSSYAQNYLTEAERLKPVQEALDAAMASLGLSCVTTREQFKATVDALDLTTEAGANQFAAMMKLADAFAKVHPEIQWTADAIQAMKDAAGGLLGNVDSAYSVVQKVAERDKAAIQKTVDAHQAAVDRLLGLSQAVHSAFDSYKTPEQKAYDRAAAQAEIRADLAIMKAGGFLSDVQTESLKKALGNATQDSSGQFSTYTDYLRDLYKTQNDIAALGDVTDDQLTVEQKALKAAEDQLKAIDDMLAQQQQAIDELKGINANGLTLVQAIEGLRGAILSAQTNPIIGATQAINQAYQSALGRAPDSAGLDWFLKQIAAGVPISAVQNSIYTSPEAQLQQMYQTLLGRPLDAAGKNFFLGNGASMADIEASIIASPEYKSRMGIPAFASGGDFLGGLRIVGERGPELEATGPARIFNASQTASLLSRLSSPAADNRELIQELRNLKAEMVPALQRIASYTNRTAVTNEDMNRRELEAQA
ncbi:phage tail length tape measure family protein [Massilia agilis]|uniref:Phage tail length tape measure family protein n=1 Tax=Massilia agilis TaxID=1811226 RepID=A0ABT2DBP7_9BURK|nr:phage tail length tape measure family protein [Massilia agilis]MCS0808691.1 phage tail length tape measure family protein [Massilia agilis]